MPAQILATKLYLPTPRAKIVLRLGLIERLDEGLSAGCRLTLISAPAGFGKTTLLSEWLAGCETPTAWLSLDEGDGDLPRFLSYLAAALQTIAPQLGQGIHAALQSPQPLPTEALLTTLLNELAAFPGRFLLVLDDYHALDSRSVDQALAFLLEHLPPQMHLVIATREDPHLPLARLRARGQLSELRLADLRFTPAEAAEFLNQVMGLHLSEADIKTLEARTEGWIAGLQLAALSMQGRPGAADFIQSFTGSNHFVLDYLIEEVLGRQPEAIQAFLLRTSILARLCGPLCESVLYAPSGSGHLTAQETLEILERSNLFVVPLDNERHWYRYHHLFGDILRQRLGQSHSPAEIAEYHRRASRWYEQSGDEPEAFQHAIHAGDLERAAALAESAWQGMDDRFQTAAWQAWVNQLPEEIIRLRPVLNIQLGLAFMNAGDPEASEARLRLAEGLLHADPGGMLLADEAQLKFLPAWIAMARAYNAHVLGDLPATVQFAELALQQLPDDDLFRRAQATIMLEFTHWSLGNLESAQAALQGWMDSMQKAGNITFAVASAFALADIQVELGQLRLAITTYQQSVRLAGQHGQEVQQVTAHHHLGLALLYHEMGQDAASAQHLQKAGQLGEKTTLIDWPYRWHLAQARLKESVGDLEAALDQLDEARRVYVKNPVPDTRPIEALKVVLYLKQGRLEKAQDWAQARGLSPDDEISYLGEFEHLVLARLLLAEAHSRQERRAFLQAAGLLERLAHSAEAQRRNGILLEILLVQALAHRAQGNPSLAFVTLEHALILAQPQGYQRLFVDEGEPMRFLLLELRRHLENQPGAQGYPLLGYVETLLAAFQRTDRGQLTTSTTKAELIEPLSERELEVLRLLAQGLTNHEISQRLVLALSTVKGHNLRIFSKLQARNRSEAVSRARQLGLL